VTDEPDGHAEVRRLLAEARLTEPMPDDVAARMDDVLAGLADITPVRDAPDAEVVSLASRRRRRIAGGLVAAAAVVVGAVLVAPHLSSSSSSAGSEAGGVAGPAASRYSGHDTGKNQGHTKSLAPQAALPSTVTRDGRVLVRPGHFSADARAVQRQLRRNSISAFDSLQTVQCADVPRGGEGFAAEYGRAPAALVFHPVRGGSQVVELYVCGSASPLRSATLPAP
jgi:hypothetical protein